VTKTRPEDDFAHLAVIDAYKAWLNTDFGFLQLTGILDVNGKRTSKKIGEFNRDGMRLIARAYTVSRNIPSHSNDAEAEALVKNLKTEAFAEIVAMGLAERAAKLVAFAKTNPVRKAAKDGVDGKPIQLASALSKLSWFLQPDDWTIFDKFVGAAVLKKNASGVSQMMAYYKAIASDWANAAPRLYDIAGKKGFNPLLGYRIVDKYLFLHGVGMWQPDAAGSKSGAQFMIEATLDQRLENATVQVHRKSLLATEQVLPDAVGKKLRNLAAEVSDVVNGTSWVSR
jgi:hypothetical protein